MVTLSLSAYEWNLLEFCLVLEAFHLVFKEICLMTSYIIVPVLLFIYLCLFIYLVLLLNEFITSVVV